MSDIMKEINEVLLRVSKEQEETSKLQKENAVQIKNMQKEIGWIGNSQEEVWIDLFRRNMKWILRKKWIYVDDVSTRFSSSVKLEDGTMLKWEYDLMWINGKDIVVVEVKNKLKTDHIKKFLEVQLPRFKTLFPSYKDYNLYGWVGSLVVWEDQEKQAEKAGLFVFTQWEDWNAMLMNSDNFRWKVF